jgi:transposase
MVTKDGFPVAHEVISGNTFEGHTMLPVIESFIRRHDVRQFTVVADAAIISSSNFEALRDAGISYIVGVRLGKVSNPLLARIDSNLPRVDGSNIRIKTDNGFLVCSFSQQR